MQIGTGGYATHLFEGLYCYLRRCIFGILSVGPVPNHIAFIMDGNRRFAKKRNLAEVEGYKAGFSALLSILRYCYELGVKYVSVYAFSIDNFRRKPKDVQNLMEMMRQKIDELLQQESIINEYGVRLHFIGNIQLLSEPVRVAAEKAMRVTAHNNQRVLLICVAYTSRDEMVHAVEESCKDKWNEVQASKVNKVSNEAIARIGQGLKRDSNGIGSHFHGSFKDYTNATKAGSSDGMFEHNVEKHSSNGVAEIAEKINKYKQGEVPSMIKLVDIEKHMYMAVAPDPDILIRTSGEARLSNFLLWQAGTCPLYAPSALWPEIGVRHLVLAVLNFQKYHLYLEKKKKQS